MWAPDHSLLTKTIATGVRNDAKGLHYPYFIDLHAFYRKNQTGFQLKRYRLFTPKQLNEFLQSVAFQ